MQPDQIALPQRGVFGVSEVLPLMRNASHELTRLQREWRQARDDAAHSKAFAKKTRANLLVTLRVFGNDETSGLPMKTSVERNEWCEADADVQSAELAADLAQSHSMDCRATLDHAEEYFGSLRSMLAIERDEHQAERSIPR